MSVLPWQWIDNLQVQDRIGFTEWFDNAAGRTELVWVGQELKMWQPSPLFCEGGGGWGGWQGGLYFPLPMPCTHGSRTFHCCSSLFVLQLLQNITQNFSVSPATLAWESRFLPSRIPPPVYFPPPFLPGSRPPIPLHIQLLKFYKYYRVGLFSVVSSKEWAYGTPFLDTPFRNSPKPLKWS